MLKKQWPYLHRKDKNNDWCSDNNGHMFPADLEFTGMICPICEMQYREKLFTDKRTYKLFEEATKND